MFLLKDNKMAVFTGDIHNTLAFAMPGDVIKTPYGNLYPAGNQVHGVLDEYIRADADKRKLMANALRASEVMLIGGYLLDSKMRLFVVRLSKTATIFHRVAQLSEKAAHAVATDAAISESMMTGLYIHETVEDIMAAICKTLRFSPKAVEYYVFTDVINEMISEERTDSVFDHLAIEPKGGTSPK